MKLLKGCFILAVLLCAVLSVDPLRHAFAPGGQAQGAVSSSGNASTVATMLSAVVAEDASALEGCSALPEGFEEECFSVEGYRNARSSDGGRIVGAITEGSAQKAFEACCAKMLEKGWTAVSSGQPTRATFLKTTGRYRWAYLDCTGIGGSVSIVIALEGES